MGVIIDSNIFIDYERGVFDLDEYIRGRQEKFYLSAITASEILHGLFRGDRSERLAKRAELIEGILWQFETLPSIWRWHESMPSYMQN
ncbi:MAG TPA: hypothetical protein VGM92_11390 [Candidatus Kapabacteria bacterium]|jgi:predicted nucleic acid-binding protein